MKKLSLRECSYRAWDMKTSEMLNWSLVTWVLIETEIEVVKSTTEDRC